MVSSLLMTGVAMRHDGDVLPNHQKRKEKTMSKITTIGLDIAKNVFHAMLCDSWGKLVKKRMLKRNEVLAFFAQLEPCLIGQVGAVHAESHGGIKSVGIFYTTRHPHRLPTTNRLKKKMKRILAFFMQDIYRTHKRAEM